MTLTRLPSSALRLTGADRVDFMQGQMTNDLKRAPTPGMVPALFLNVRGQIEFYARAYKREQDVYLHLAAGEAAALSARLRRYIIFDQVDVQDLTDQLHTVHVWTPEGVPAWNASGPPVQTLTLAGHDALAARVNRTGREGLDLHVLSAHAQDVLNELALPETPLEELERARVHAGLPDVTSDRWQGSLLQEVGLDDAISYRKGCYVGQEIMARLEARGNARHRLVALEGENLPSHTEVVRDGRTVGQTGHSVGDRVLAKLRKEIEVGETVDIAGVTARVADARPAASPETGRAG